MVGRDVNFIVEKGKATPGQTVLKVENLNYCKKNAMKNALTDINFEVKRGEIVCIAGIDGNGQSELVYALTGMLTGYTGKIILNNEDITHYSVRQRNLKGISHIPEDRHKHGLVLDYNLAENMILKNYFNKDNQKHGFLKFENIYNYADRLIEKFDVRSGQGSHSIVRGMSGGNQQKAIIAREIESNCDLLIAVQPTRGLDVGAIEFIHKQLIQQRDEGHAVLLISLVIPNQALEGFSILLRGGFYRGIKSVGEVLYLSVPIMMTGLSVAFAFKCGLFNIGTPGQYIVGAFASMFIAFNATFIPESIRWIFAVLAGGLAGALWASVPGLLKAYCNVNVVISSIMMNYIGMLLVIEGVKKFMYNPTGAESYTIPTSLAIPNLGLDQVFNGSSINLGTFIAIGVCILAYVIMNKTTFGYELKATGYNPDASKYAGMNEKKSIVLSMVIAGFFAGLGGALVYMAGTGRTIGTAEVLAAEGFNGIPVALLGFNNPLGVIFAALFIAYINLGGNYVQAVHIAVEIIDVIVAAIIYFSSFTLFIRLILERRKGRKKDKKQALIGGDE